MNLWLFYIGLFSILAQVVLLRELTVAFFGSELITLLSLGFWLFWSALGAAAERIGRAPSFPRVRLLFLLSSPLLVLDLALIRRIQILFGGVPGADLPFLVQLGATAMALMPISVIYGWLFQTVAKQWADQRGALARAYAIESAGGLVGGGLATGFLAMGLQNLSIATLGALIAVGASMHPVKMQRISSKPSRPVIVMAALMGVFALLTLGYGGRIDRAWTAWNHPLLLDTVDTPYGRTTVSGQLGQISVFENNALVLESEGTAAEELVHVAGSLHPDPRSFLLLGGAAQGVIREAQKYAPRRLTAVELDRRAWQVAERHLPSAFISSASVPRPPLRFSDPRRLLAESRATYDLIIVAMPEPGSAQSARYYTQEFYQLCARRLEPGGIIAFRLRSAENLWTPSLAQRTASIAAALRSAFTSVIVFPGSANLFVASRQPLPLSPEVPAQRLRARHLPTRLVSPYYITYLYTNDRFGYISSKLSALSMPANSDARPVCYPYTLMIWLSKHFPALATVDIGATLTWVKRQAVWGWLILLLLALGFRWTGRWPLVRRSLLAAVAGSLGMVGESLLLIRYQVSSGVLYQDLGLLLTLFMAGLVGGSMATYSWAKRAWSRGPISKGFGVSVIGALCALNLAIAWIAPTDRFTSMLWVGGALAITGVLVAALFAYASLDQDEAPSRLVSPLYAADLLGGCFGSLAAGLVLIPVVGISGSFVVSAVVAMTALALL